MSKILYKVAKVDVESEAYDFLTREFQSLDEASNLYLNESKNSEYQYWVYKTEYDANDVVSKCYYIGRFICGIFQEKGQ